MHTPVGINRMSSLGYSLVLRSGTQQTGKTKGGKVCEVRSAETRGRGSSRQEKRRKDKKREEGKKKGGGEAERKGKEKNYSFSVLFLLICCVNALESIYY